MSTDPTKIGLTFPSSRMERDRQEGLLRAAGARSIFHVGEHALASDWRGAVNSLCRFGDTIYVVALVLVPTARTKADSPPASQPGEFIADAMAEGCVVVEVMTGLRSDDRDQRRRMISQAVLGIQGGGRRFPPGVNARGRPKADCSDVLVDAEKVWRSRAYSTNEAAVAHMPPCKDPRTGVPIPWTLERAFREFKASGRPWKRGRRQKTG